MGMTGTDKNTMTARVINYLVWFRILKASLPREKFISLVKEAGLDEFSVPKLPKKPQAVRQTIREELGGKNLFSVSCQSRLAVIETGRDPDLVFQVSKTSIDRYKKDYKAEKCLTILYDCLHDKLELKFDEKLTDEEKEQLANLTKDIISNSELLTVNITNKQIASYVSYYLENTIRFRATAGVYYIHPKHKELLEKLDALIKKTNEVAKLDLAKMEFDYIALIDPVKVSDSLIGSIQEEAEQIKKKIEIAEITSEEGQKLLQQVHGLRQKVKESEEFLRSQQEQVWTLLNNLDTAASKVVTDALASGEIDNLTQLYTRTKFITLARNILSNNLDAKWSVAMLDIDFFKKLNDTYGHQFGDRCLQVISNTIKSNLKEPNIAGRYGGEEFIIFFLEPLDSAVDNCGAIRKAIEKIEIRKLGNWEIRELKKPAPNSKSPSFPITISIGVVEGGKDAGLEAVIGLADKLLYKAKNGGRNRVESEVVSYKG